MTVTALLASACTAHRSYRQIHAQSKGTNLLGMAQAIEAALNARTDAETLDPGYTDSAWAQDAIEMKASHTSLVLFYVRYLAPPAAYVQDVATLIQA